MEATMETIKVLIVDDHTLVRYGISCLLEEQEGFLVVGQAGNGFEAVQIAREMQPDIILIFPAPHRPATRCPPHATRARGRSRTI